MSKLAERLIDTRVKNTKSKEKLYKLDAGAVTIYWLKPMHQNASNLSLGLILKKTRLQIALQDNINLASHQPTFCHSLQSDWSFA